MRTELIQECQMLQQSRANHFADFLSEQIRTSVDAVNEKISSSMSQRGNMLMQLDRKLNFSTLRMLRRKYLKF